MPEITAAQVQAVREAAVALGQVIKEETASNPLGGIPAGHLYAAVMSKLSHEMFEQLIGLLVQARVVRRMPSHLLVWIGGDKKPGATVVNPAA